MPRPITASQERAPSWQPQMVRFCCDDCGFILVVNINWPFLLCVVCLWCVLWKESAGWRSNNVITMDCFSYEPSASIDCAPHAKAYTREGDEHVQCLLSVFMATRVTDGLRSSSQAMPSRQAPIPSYHLTQAPPPWPLTLRTDQPIPAVYRWLSSGHHMLTTVNHHSSQQTLALLFLCLASFSLCAYFNCLNTQATLYFYLSRWASVQSPGGLFLFSLLTPVGSCSISVSLLLALSYIHLVSLSPVITVIHLPLACSFLSFLSKCPLSLSPALLPHFTTALSWPSLWTQFWKCISMSVFVLSIPPFFLRPVQ